jgi:hypothetical protein
MPMMAVMLHVNCSEHMGPGNGQGLNTLNSRQISLILCLLHSLY